MISSNSEIPEEIYEYFGAYILISLNSYSETNNRPASIKEIRQIAARYLSRDGERTGSRIFFLSDLDNALEFLEHKGLISAIKDPFADSFYAISPIGMDEIEKHRGSTESVLGKYLLLGAPWLNSVFENVSFTWSPETEQTAQVADGSEEGGQIDDAWEPIPVDRESPEYEKAIRTLGEAIDALEADNGYAANNPEERDHVVWSLRQGFVALSERLPSASQVKALVLEPLQRAISTLKGSATGLLALAAQEAVKELIKSWFR